MKCHGYLSRSTQKYTCLPPHQVFRISNHLGALGRNIWAAAVPANLNEYWPELLPP
jgi:hypothetical protein